MMALETQLDDHHELLLTCKIDFALVWTTVARTAYERKRLPEAQKARQRAVAAYYIVRQLATAILAEENRRVLLAEMDALEMALDRLAELGSILAEA